MKNIWNVVLHTVEDNKVRPSKNNITPKESGKYLCTCANFWDGEECERYLQMMYYDVKSNHWTDVNSRSHISHNVLAWTDAVELCDFNDFEYLAGGYFLEKERENEEK